MRRTNVHGCPHAAEKKQHTQSNGYNNPTKAELTRTERINTAHLRNGRTTSKNTTSETRPFLTVGMKKVPVTAVLSCLCQVVQQPPC